MWKAPVRLSRTGASHLGNSTVIGDNGHEIRVDGSESALDRKGLRALGRRDDHLPGGELREKRLASGKDAELAVDNRVLDI